MLISGVIYYLISDMCEQRPSTHNMWEILIFNNQGNYFEKLLEEEPLFTCTRLQSDCQQCYNATERHEHFLVVEEIERCDNYDETDSPESVYYLSELIKIHYFVLHERPRHLPLILPKDFYAYYLEAMIGCPPWWEPRITKREHDRIHQWMKDQKANPSRRYLMWRVVTSAAELFESISRCNDRTKMERERLIIFIIHLYILSNHFEFFCLLRIF